MTNQVTQLRIILCTFCFWMRNCLCLMFWIMNNDIFYSPWCLAWKFLRNSQFSWHLMGMLLVKSILGLKFVKATQPLKLRTVWTLNWQKAETQTIELTILDNKSILVIFHSTMRATIYFCSFFKKSCFKFLNILNNNAF